ncbi:MAG: cation:proton antiporter [Candidatus Competibacterales bacterium]
MLHELGSLIGLLALSVIVISLFRRLHLPPILAYLATGIGLSPWLWVDPHLREELRELGELGVALLLFSIGLEFSLKQVWAMRRTLFGLGGAQGWGGAVSGGLLGGG